MKKYYTTASGILHEYVYKYKPTERGIQKRRIREIINEILGTIDKTLLRSDLARLIIKELKDKYNIELKLDYVLNYLRNRFGAVKKN